MAKKLTQEEFIKRATKIHNGKYDYSKVEYVKSNKKVCIICPVHGEFWQTPTNHLMKHGCVKCMGDDSKKRIFGVGINDLNEGNSECYIKWHSMLRRCYSKVYHSRFPAYKKCTVCEDWLTYSNFNKWYNEHYVDGYALDKDILYEENTEYSPSKCCFVPQNINNEFIHHTKKRDLPTGVYKRKSKRGIRYYVQITKKRRHYCLGNYENPQDALDRYKAEKEAYMHELAEEYKGVVDINVYNALKNYTYKPTDEI